MKASFNLIDRPWIPCIGHGSAHAKPLSLRETLHRAHELTGIWGTTPPETAALHRLLLAVLYRALWHDDTEEAGYTDWWKKRWMDRRLDRVPSLNEYLDQWRHRFDLFDSVHPFFQDPSLQRDSESVSSLMAHIASGNNPTLFDHHTKFDPRTGSGGIALTPAEAARALIAVQSFGLCGTKGRYMSFSDAPCARGVAFLMEGQTLFETLMLNLFDPYIPENRFPHRTKYGDRPAWEMDKPFEDDPARPYGYLDYLTWHNRRIRLLPEFTPSGLGVQEMMYEPGLKTYDAKNKSVRETFNPLMYWIPNEKPRRARKRSHRALPFDKGRALWRDSTVLLRLPSGDDDSRAKPPQALRWVQSLVPDVLKPEQVYRYLALGMCSQPGQAKVFFYRMEVMPLPLKYLKDEELVGRLSQALEAAEKTGGQLRFAVFTLARLLLKPATTDKELKEKKPSKEEAKRITKLANSWGVERYYWSGLELHFHRLLKDLPNDSQAALDEWYKQLRRAARYAFECGEAYAGQDRRTQRAIVKAREQFDRGLGRTLRSPTQKEGGNV
jgi:CRISPR system Cascade subunit CasA